MCPWDCCGGWQEEGEGGKRKEGGEEVTGRWWLTILQHGVGFKGATG